MGCEGDAAAEVCVCVLECGAYRKWATQSVYRKEATGKKTPSSACAVHVGESPSVPVTCDNMHEG